MATSNIIKGYFRLNGTLLSEDNSEVFRGTSGANQLQVITPVDTSYSADVTFLLNNGRTVEYKSLRNEGTEQVEVSPSVFETWNVYAYDVTSDVLSTVSLLTSSPLYYSARFREQDPLYFGALNTSTVITDDSTIDTEIKALSRFDNPVDENYITVTSTFGGELNTSTYEFDTDTGNWEYLGFEKSQFIQVLNTEQVQLTVFPTVVGTDVNISASELDIIKQWLTDLEQEIDDIEAVLKTTVDGFFTIDDDNAWSSDKRIHNHLASTYMPITDYDPNTYGDTVEKARSIDDGIGGNLEVSEIEVKADKDSANGYAGLDANSQINASALPTGTKVFKGTFGSTGDLPSGVQRVGDTYRCDEDDYTSVVAGLTFDTNDTATYTTGDVWVKNDSADAVDSVNGKVGVVVLDKWDVPITHTVTTQSDDGVGGTDNIIDYGAPASTIATNGMRVQVDLSDIVTGVGLVEARLNATDTLRPAYDYFGNQINIGSQAIFAEMSTFVLLDNVWKLENTSGDVPLIVGDNWDGTQLDDVKAENDTQNNRLDAVELALATPGENILQVVDLTAPIVAGVTPLTKFVFGTTSTPSNDTNFVTLNGNNDQVVVDSLPVGYTFNGNFTVTKTSGNPNTPFSVSFYLFNADDPIVVGNELDSLTVESATTGLPNDRSKSITIDDTVIQGLLPLTLEVYYTVNSGGGTLDEGNLAVLSLFSSSGIPIPTNSGSVTLLDPVNEAYLGTGTKQNQANVQAVTRLKELDTDVAELQEEVINSTVDKDVPYNGAQGTFGTSKDSLPVAIKGTNILPFKGIQGSTLSQLVVNGNFQKDTDDNGIADNFTTTGVITTSSMANGIQKITPASQYAGLQYSLLNGEITTGVTYYFKALIKSNAPDITLVFGDDLFFATSKNYTGDGEWQLVSKVFAVTNFDGSGFIRVRSNNPSTYGEIEIKEVVLIPLPSDISTVESIELLLDNTYFEGTQNAGSGKTFNQLLDNRNEFSAFTTFTNSTVDKTTLEVPYINANYNFNNIVDLTWVANTQYTVLTHIVDNTQNAVITVVRGTNIDGSSLSIPTGFNGVDKQVFITGNTPLTSHRANGNGTSGNALYRSIIIEGDHTNITDAEALAIIQEEEYGEFTRSGINIKSVGKNKLPAPSKWEQGSFDSSDNLVPATNRIRCTELIQVSFGTTYVFSTIGSYTFSVNELDSTGNLVNSYGLITVDSTYTPTDSSVKQLRVSLRRLDNADLLPEELVTAEAMLEIKSVLPASEYEEYIDTYAKVDTGINGLAKLPNGVYDDELTNRIKPYTLQEGDIDQYDTSTYTNIDVVRLIKNTDAIYSGSTAENAGTILFPNYNQVFQGIVDNVSEIGNLRIYVSASRYYLYVAKGEYTDLADAKSSLAGTVIQYELETYIPRNDVNNNIVPIDGLVISDSVATYEVSTPQGVLPTQWKVTQPLNLNAQIQQNIITDLKQQNTINELQGEQDNVKQDVNEIKDKTNFITVTEDVNLDDVNTNKTDIDNVEAKTDFITVTQAVNLDTMESDIGNIETKTDNITVTGAINLDKVHERTLIFSGTLTANTSSTQAGGSQHSIGAFDFDDYDSVELRTSVGGGILNYGILTANGNLFDVLTAITNLGATATSVASFRIERTANSTFYAYWGRNIPLNGTTTATTITVTNAELWGIKN